MSKMVRYNKEQLLELQRYNPFDTSKVKLDSSDDDLVELIDSNVVKKVGRPKNPDAKEAISIRLDKETLNLLRKSGRGWQSRLSRQINRLAKQHLL